MSKNEEKLNFAKQLFAVEPISVIYFRKVEFRNLGPKLPKQIPRIFFHLKFLPSKYSSNNSETSLKQEKLMALAWCEITPLI